MYGQAAYLFIFNYFCVYFLFLFFNGYFPNTIFFYCTFVFILFIYLLSFVFLGPHPRHMEDPRLGVKSEPQLQANTTATAMRDLSHICDLCCSLWQHRIFNSLSEARDQTHILTDTVFFINPLSHNRNSSTPILEMRQVVSQRG